MEMYCKKCATVFLGALDGVMRCAICDNASFSTTQPEIVDIVPDEPLTAWELTDNDKIHLIHYGIRVD